MVSKRTQPVKRSKTTTRSGQKLSSTRVGDLAKSVSTAVSKTSPSKSVKSSKLSFSLPFGSSSKGQSTSTDSSAAPGATTKRAPLRRSASTAKVVRSSSSGAAARAAANYRKYLLGIAAAVAAVVLVIVAYIALYNSNVFEIEEVSVKGVDHLTATDLQNLAGVEQGTTLLNVDSETIREQLMVDAWVQDVKINRIFPHTLELVVTERTIEAVVKVPSSDGSTTVDWAIASDGMWLMPIPAQDSEAGQLVNPQVYEDAANALVISDVPYTTKPEVGSYCSDANVNNALAIVSGLTTELSGRVTAVKATETESTTLTIKDGPDIVFGTADDIREKERVCLEIMNSHPDGVSYINVRSVNRPTYRAL